MPSLVERFIWTLRKRRIGNIASAKSAKAEIAAWSSQTAATARDELERPTALKIGHVDNNIETSTGSRNVYIPNSLDGNALKKFRCGQQNIADEHKNDDQPKKRILEFVAIDNAFQKKRDWDLGETGGEGSNKVTKD